MKEQFSVMIPKSSFSVDLLKVRSNIRPDLTIACFVVLIPFTPVIGLCGR